MDGIKKEEEPRGKCCRNEHGERWVEGLGERRSV